MGQHKQGVRKAGGVLCWLACRGEGRAAPRKRQPATSSVDGRDKEGEEGGTTQQQTTALLVIIGDQSGGGYESTFVMQQPNLLHKSKSPSSRFDWMVIDKRCWRVSTSTVTVRVRRSCPGPIGNECVDPVWRLIYERRLLAVVAASSRL
jgi:hypothetical protein